MDKRKNNGGHSNGGRKPKADEQKLIERLTPLQDAGYKALEDGLKDSQSWAVKLFFEYMYGKPKQQIEQNNTHAFTDGFDIKKLYDKET
tara:strand:+ start:296 stop:562 length:267 start_codon:yes stop_codon:yes gene_type:complete